MHQVLAQGEAFLTIRQFHALMQQQQIRGSLRNLYRWLDVPKEHLPQEIRDMLAHAPSLWFVRFGSKRYAAGNQPGIAIPVRYLAQHLQDRCLHQLVDHGSPLQALRTLRAMQVNLARMQQELDGLSDYLETLSRKDITDEHGTHQHSLTA